LKTILRLLVFLRPFAGEVILSIFLGAGTVAAAMGLLGTSAYLIASAARQPSIATLQVAIVGVRFFGIARGGLRYLERLVSHSVNFRLLARLRVWFYRAVEPLAPAGLEDLRGGDLLNRAAADIEMLENFYVRAAAPPVTALVVTLGVCAFVGQYAAILSWVLAAGMGVGGFLVPLITHSIARRYGVQSTKARAQLSAEVVDTIQGMGDLTAFGCAEEAIGRAERAGQVYEQAQSGMARAGSLGTALTGLSANLTMYCVVLLVIPMVRATTLDGVALAVLALVTLAAFEAVTPLSQTAQQLETTLQSARRLFDLADQRPSVQAPAAAAPAPRGADLQVRGLSFRYGPNLQAVLDGVDLDLPAGKRVAVVGPSGAGKSSLAGVLARLYDCPPGAVVLDGRDIRGYNPEDVRKRIAYAPQPVYLFSGTLRDNLVLVLPEASESELQAAVEDAGLGPLVKRLPRGLDGRVGSQGEQLSGGERQRVAVARTLLSGAGLIILDEPTAGLDATSAQTMMDALRATTVGRGLLVITHRLSGLEWFDEIVVLRAGRGLERGTHAALMAQDGWYRRALELQNRLLDPGEL
jgi:thiol reductant ABC exporter CydC subunit